MTKKRLCKGCRENKIFPSDHVIRKNRVYGAAQAGHLVFEKSAKPIYGLIERGELPGTRSGRGRAIRVTGRALLNAVDGITNRTVVIESRTTTNTQEPERQTQ